MRLRTSSYIAALALLVGAFAGWAAADRLSAKAPSRAVTAATYELLVDDRLRDQYLDNHLIHSGLGVQSTRPVPRTLALNADGRFSWSERLDWSSTDSSFTDLSSEFGVSRSGTGEYDLLMPKYAVLIFDASDEIELRERCLAIEYDNQSLRLRQDGIDHYYRRRM